MGEFRERVGTCLSELLTDEALQEFDSLSDRPEGTPQAMELLHDAVPSHLSLIGDVQTTLVDELVHTAKDGVIPTLDSWPVALPDLDTRAGVVLWCRGYRPSDTELRAASDRVDEAAERRGWDEQVPSLSLEEHQTLLGLRNQVEQGRAGSDTLAEWWNSHHPNTDERYLFHLGEAINDLLAHWRSAEA